MRHKILAPVFLFVLLVVAGIVVAQESGASSGSSTGQTTEPLEGSGGAGSGGSGGASVVDGIPEGAVITAYGDSYQQPSGHSVPATPGLAADPCESNSDCRWCGNTCGAFPAGSICPAVMPPEGYGCVCSSGKCALMSPQSPGIPVPGSSGAAETGMAGMVAPVTIPTEDVVNASSRETGLLKNDTGAEAGETSPTPLPVTGPAFLISGSGHTFVLGSGSVNASSALPVKSEGDAVYIESGQRKIEIKVMPDKAAERANDVLDTITFMKLDAEEQPAYDVVGRKKGMLFGFIPVSLDIKARILADTGEIQDVERPWWAFLVMI